jgi:DNA-binding response OmpR family regulator
MDEPELSATVDERHHRAGTLVGAVHRELIAVVDDDESVRVSLRDLLLDLGFAVATFSSAEEFLFSELLEQTTCLLLDVHMPGMTGTALQKELLRRQQRIPIVFISGGRGESVPPTRLEHSAAECLLKPISQMALLAAFDVVLRTGGPPTPGESGAFAVAAALDGAGSGTQLAVGEGSLVGRFRLEQLLGEGGMGSVYRAVDAVSGQRVALKVLRRELLGDESAKSRFQKEARVLEAVHGPYVANLVEADMSQRRGYIALELVEGQDLASLMEERQEAFSEAVALQIIADVCRALIEPHRRGIVHRDIKPQNVLIVGSLTHPAELRVKLCDFGIASASLGADTLDLSLDGRLWGTPRYMSPEQCTYGPVSPATDVYALGLTLYELLAGRPAFEGQNLAQIFRSQMTAAPAPLATCTDVSRGCEALVTRAIHKQPARRFADAAALLAAIDAVRSGNGVPATKRLARVQRPREHGAGQSPLARQGSMPLRDRIRGLAARLGLGRGEISASSSAATARAGPLS